MDRDYHKLARRRLQQLCKKVGIPANKTNVFMADALTEHFKKVHRSAAPSGSRVGDSQSSQCTTEENLSDPRANGGRGGGGGAHQNVESQYDEDKNSVCMSGGKAESDDAHSGVEEVKVQSVEEQITLVAVDTVDQNAIVEATASEAAAPEGSVLQQLDNSLQMLEKKGGNPPLDSQEQPATDDREGTGERIEAATTSPNSDQVEILQAQVAVVEALQPAVDEEAEIQVSVEHASQKPVPPEPSVERKNQELIAINQDGEEKSAEERPEVLKTGGSEVSYVSHEAGGKVESGAAFGDKSFSDELKVQGLVSPKTETVRIATHATAGTVAEVKDEAVQELHVKAGSNPEGGDYNLLAEPEKALQLPTGPADMQLKLMLRRALQRSKSRNRYKKKAPFRKQAADRVVLQARNHRIELLTRKRLQKATEVKEGGTSDAEKQPEVKNTAAASAAKIICGRKVASVQKKHKEQFKASLKGKSRQKAEASLVNLAAKRRDLLLRTKRGL